MPKRGDLKLDVTRLEEVKKEGLTKGRHNVMGDFCIMEAVAYVTHDVHTDHPVAVCSVIAAFARTFNDAIDYDSRQRLLAYVDRMIGTGGQEEKSLECAAMLAEWAAMTILPMTCEMVGLNEEAENLRNFSDHPEGMRKYIELMPLKRGEAEMEAACCHVGVAARARNALIYSDSNETKETAALNAANAYKTLLLGKMHQEDTRQALVEVGFEMLETLLNHYWE